MSNRNACRAALVIAISSWCTAANAQLPTLRVEPINQVGRFFGFGYSDGYHECKEPRSTQRGQLAAYRQTFAEGHLRSDVELFDTPSTVVREPVHNGAHPRAGRSNVELYDTPSTVGQRPFIHASQPQYANGSSGTAFPQSQCTCPACRGQFSTQTPTLASPTASPDIAPVPNQVGATSVAPPPMPMPYQQLPSKEPSSEEAAKSSKTDSTLEQDAKSEEVPPPMPMPSDSPSDSSDDDLLLEDDLQYEEIPEFQKDAAPKSDESLLQEDEDLLLVPDDAYHPPRRLQRVPAKPVAPRNARVPQPINRYR